MITKTEVLEIEGFYFVGILVRTTNQNGQSVKDIGGLWAQFMQDVVLQRIDERLSDDIYCIYTDYESDHTGPYTAILGCKVNSLDNIPNGLTGITIPADKYQIYALEGKLPDAVGEAWFEIWNTATDRKYTADFDVYSANAKSFEETEVKIYIAVN